MLNLMAVLQEVGGAVKIAIINILQYYSKRCKFYQPKCCKFKAQSRKIQNKNPYTPINLTANCEFTGRVSKLADNIFLPFGVYYYHARTTL
jgi:hypothetical protein